MSHADAQQTPPRQGSPPQPPPSGQQAAPATLPDELEEVLEELPTAEPELPPVEPDAVVADDGPVDDAPPVLVDVELEDDPAPLDDDVCTEPRLDCEVTAPPEDAVLELEVAVAEVVTVELLVAAAELPEVDELELEPPAVPVEEATEALVTEDVSDAVVDAPPLVAPWDPDAAVDPGAPELVTEWVAAPVPPEDPAPLDAALPPDEAFP